MRTHPIEHYQALRDSAPRLSRAATLPKGTKLELGRGTHLGTPSSANHTAADRMNREGSQLAASLEGEPGPTPAGKTLPHSYPEIRFRRERGIVLKKHLSWCWIYLVLDAQHFYYLLFTIYSLLLFTIYYNYLQFTTMYYYYLLQIFTTIYNYNSIVFLLLFVVFDLFYIYSRWRFVDRCSSDHFPAQQTT